MATYLEIKQFLKEILELDYEVDEEIDLIINVSGNQDESIVLPNDMLKQGFEKMTTFSKHKLEMFDAKYREACILWSSPRLAMIQYGPVLESVEDGLTYKFGVATNEYCLLLLSYIVDSIKQYGYNLPRIYKYRVKTLLNKYNDDRVVNPSVFLSRLFSFYTLKITSEKEVGINKLREFAIAFRFLCMYRQNAPMIEGTDLRDIVSLGESGITRSRVCRNIDTPPRRTYNNITLDYYTAAMESRDPFAMYISYYHVIEYYFDEIFKKKLVSNIKEKITHPGFSYKRDDDVYQLAKYIRKHMNNDSNSGKGNEFESLKYVLQEFVDVRELRDRILMLDSSAVDYYNENFVPFTTSTKTKIVWNDTGAVHTNIATRIYETRNALVHSKSEQINNQYKPYENKNDLIKEIPLIRAVAEAVLIGASKEI